MPASPQGEKVGAAVVLHVLSHHPDVVFDRLDDRVHLATQYLLRQAQREALDRMEGDM